MARMGTGLASRPTHAAAVFTVLKPVGPGRLMPRIRAAAGGRQPRQTVSRWGNSVSGDALWQPTTTLRRGRRWSSGRATPDHHGGEIAVTEQPQPPPAGWYPTPDGRLRYWDGGQWTDSSAVPAAPTLSAPYQARRGRALKWILLAVGLVLVVAGGSGIALLVTAGGETCDPVAVNAFESMPAYPGAEVELRVSPGIGCTDTVQPADPDAFIDHYEKAMRDAGWTVRSDDDAFGRGASGTGPSGGVRLDRLEGDDVGVYVLSPSGYPPENP